MSAMTKVLQEAIDTIATLPDSEQDKIGRELLDHVERIRALRADLQAGVDSLDAGKGAPIDMRDIIDRARARNAGR